MCWLICVREVYRSKFEPSVYLDKPYAMVGVNVVAADTDEEARYLFTSQQMQSVNMMRGRREAMPSPIDDIEMYWTPGEKPAADHKLTYSFVGAAETIEKELGDFIGQTGADEIITTVRIYDPAACLRSLEILAGIDAVFQPSEDAGALTFED